VKVSISVEILVVLIKLMILRIIRMVLVRLMRDSLCFMIGRNSGVVANRKLMIGMIL
jgi:hypothetical protein